MRGEICALRDDRYASKARPVVIVQNDEISSFDSVVLCLLTTFKVLLADVRPIATAQIICEQPIPMHGSGVRQTIESEFSNRFRLGKWGGTL